MLDGGPFTGPCHFIVQLGTVTTNGRYAPNNVGAIWIETKSGAFVKTLRTWGLLMLNSATPWTAVSMGNRVDAVSSATRHSHEQRIRATWNCTDAAYAPVADGEYQLCATVAEDHARYDDAGNLTHNTPPSICIPFTLGANVIDYWPATDPPFVALHIFLQPRL